MKQPETWVPESWRSAPTRHQPRWPDPELSREVLRSVERLPELVPVAEVDGLRESLSQAASGSRLVLHAGECAERFDAVSITDVRARLALLGELAALFGSHRTRPAVVIGRIAGQYAKPRSAPTSLVARGQGLTEVPSYLGDMVNGTAPDAVSRRPDPHRLRQAYHFAAATMCLMRGLTVPTPPAPLPGTGVFASHEALVLGYEQAMTRRRGDTGGWFNAGAHLLWCGYRTCGADGGHVEYLSGISNPVGLKVGGDLSADDLRRICHRLDPLRTPGRLTLIARMGRTTVGERLSELVGAVRDSGHQPAWVCDPMHGNTFTAPDGRKTRRVEDMLEEIADFVDILAAQGVVAAGLHLEVSADEVTECVGGPSGPSPQGLSRRYLTACDPRLNPRQARFVVEQTARLFTPRAVIP